MNPLIEKLRLRLPDLEIDAGDTSCAAYRIDANGFGGERPLAVAWPRSVEHVQALVAEARAEAFSLVPVSSGGEHHRGDTTCTARSVVVSMEKLCRILRVDRRNRVALFEAGVGFPELARALRSHALRPLLPLCPRPGKSALASYLEREPTIYPRFQWDISDPLLCTEVVFGTGEWFRTGAAAGPGSLEQQWAAGDAQKSPLGPGQSDLMRLVQGAQGTVGVVTWCSAKAEPLPSDERLHLVAAPELPPVVRLARMLLRRRHADLLFLVSGAALAAILCREREQYRIAAGRADHWYLVYSLSAPQYFPEDRLAYVQREIRELLDETGLEPARPPAGTPDLLHSLLTCPDRHEALAYWKKAGRECARELFFQTTLDKAERFLARIAERAVSAGRRPEDLLLYVQPQLGGRCCHVEAVFAHGPGERDAVEALVLGLAHDLADRGAFFSRPYGPLVDVAFSRSSTAWIVPKVKQMFDPDGVLSPGRLDVSAHVREAAPGQEISHAQQ